MVTKSGQACPEHFFDVARAGLIFNPMSGRQGAARVLPELLRTLHSHGFVVEPLPTAGPGDAVRLARAQVAAGDVEVVFALGGDGTLREVAAGLIGSDVALAPLPAGTANVLALALGIPSRARAAAQALAHRVTRLIDVGQAGVEPFLMMASCGLDAAVMARQNPSLKKTFGRLAIVASGLRRLIDYQFPTLALELDGEKIEGSFFVAANIPLYGGPFRIAPADPADGLLDLVLFQGRGRGATMAFAFDLARGRHLHRPDVVMRRFECLRFLGPSPFGLQVDGDVLAIEPPLEIGIRRQALKVVVPA